MLTGHSKAVTDVKYAVGGALLTSSADKTVRLWKPSDGSYGCAATMADHADEARRSTHASSEPSHSAFWALVAVARLPVGSATNRPLKLR